MDVPYRFNFDLTRMFKSFFEALARKCTRELAGTCSTCAKSSGSANSQGGTSPAPA
jgi:hypothetical protein